MGYRFALFVARVVEQGAGSPVWRVATVAVDGVMSGAVSNRYESESEQKESGDLLHYATCPQVSQTAWPS